MRFSLRSKVSIVFSLVAILAIVGGFSFMWAGASIHTAKATGFSVQLTKLQERLLDGFVSSELDLQKSNVHTNEATRNNYFPTSDDGCPQNRGDNVKVNQNCLNITDINLQGRGQAENETSIAQDPFHPEHIIASYNDYRRGDGNCYGSFSLNGGRTWADTTIPMGFTRGTAFGNVARQYWQAGGDTAVAWDTKGNAYFQCMVFMRGDFGLTNNPDESSGIYVFRSTQNFGASWNFPGRPVAEQNNNPGPLSQLPLLDKPYMTVDNHVGSSFQDRVYVTWTLFATDGTAKIYEAHSSDFGQTFSSPVLVSTPSSLCPISVVGSNNCDANQFSDPFTGPDGALYVVWDNFNNSLSSATDNHNQVLLAKSTDGGATFSAPILVANYNDLPDCPTYQNGQDPFRACVPEKGSAQNSVFRAANYPSGAVNPTNASQVVVTFGSYINADSNPSNGCVPAGLAANGDNVFIGVKTPGACNNKILESVSTNAGVSFKGTITDPTTLTVVSSAPGQKLTDQWWQWEAFTKGGKLAVSYFDRQYGNDEFNGFMDYSLSGSKDLTNFGVLRVTSESMPPPTQFTNGFGNGVFFGDYSGLTAVDDAHPLWMDTRSPDLALCPGTPPKVCTFTESNGVQANDQDIFTSSEGVPSK